MGSYIGLTLAVFTVAVVWAFALVEAAKWVKAKRRAKREAEELRRAVEAKLDEVLASASAPYVPRARPPRAPVKKPAVVESEPYYPRHELPNGGVLGLSDSGDENWGSFSFNTDSGGDYSGDGGDSGGGGSSDSF